MILNQLSIAQVTHLGDCLRMVLHSVTSSPIHDTKRQEHYINPSYSAIIHILDDILLESKTNKSATRNKIKTSIKINQSGCKL